MLTTTNGTGGEDMEEKKLHDCNFDAMPSSGYSSALDYCYELEDGTLWVGNGEYGSQVNYCPYCGYKATVQISLDQNPIPEPFKLELRDPFTPDGRMYFGPAHDTNLYRIVRAFITVKEGDLRNFLNGKKYYEREDIQAYLQDLLQQGTPK